MDPVEEEDPASKQKRCNYYSYADAGFVQDVKRFISGQEFRVEKKYGHKKFIKLLTEWRSWFDYYLSGEPKTAGDLLSRMPPSWSSSEPLPMCFVITEGHAGTGKTFSINTLMQTVADGTVSSYARKGTDAFLEYAVADTIPNGLSHIIENNTMCKMFRIKFSQQRVRARLEDLKKDRELEQSYAEMLGNMHGAKDPICAEHMTRRHFALAALKLWPVVTECNDAMLKDFFYHGSSAFRRTIMDESHPHYTGDQLVPAFLVKHNDILKAAAQGVSSDKMSREDAQHRVQMSEAILHQDTYRLAVAMGQKTRNICPPPPSALFPVLLFEEDGMAPAFYGDLRKLLIMLTMFTYLPPFMFSRIPVIVSSGSTTQSAAIGTTASALQMCATPSHLQDRDNVLAYRAEFFRRDKNSFKGYDMLACRTTCMMLERCLPQSDWTYTSMLAHEEHSNLVDDPNFLPQGTRLYRRHDHVREYTKKMSESGKAEVPLTDILFVADNVVPINRSLKTTEMKTGLSRLSRFQAKNNRLGLWKSKQCLYRAYTAGGENEWATGIDYYTEDKGCKGIEEEMITQAHREAIVTSRQLRHNSQQGKKRALDEEVEESVQSCATGTVLASDETFSESTREDITYDSMVSGISDQRRIVKTKNTPEGLTQVTEEVVTDKQEEKNGLTFIVGRAVDLLSREEHMTKRSYAETIALKLGTGTKLAENYLTGSKVVDQEGVMTYDPMADLVVEYARPNYDSDDFSKSVEQTTNARILYMAFKRQRRMVKNTPVTMEKQDAMVVFRGLESTAMELMQNEIFTNYAPHAFKTMIFGGVIEKYREWQICQAAQESTLMGTIDQVSMERMYKLFYHKISPHAIHLIEEYDRLVDEAEATVKKRSKINVERLMASLSRMVNRICNHPEGQDAKFARSVKLIIYADNVPLYSLLKYQNRAVELIKLRLTSIGDIKLLDTGKHACNAVWRMEREKEYTRNISSPGRYPYSLMQQETYCKTSPNKILMMGLEAFQHELFLESISTLLLVDSIIVTTQPACFAHVRWSTIFTEPKRPPCSPYFKQDLFGLCLRRGMADARNHISSVVNGMFLLNGGELMNLPRPFKERGCPSPSDVIIKTRNVVMQSSNKQNAVSTVPTPATDDEEDLRVKRVESIMMFGCMNPMYGMPASTVAYAQGSTHQGYVLLNFTKIGKGDQLVGMTRTSDTKKLKVADVMVAAREKETAPTCAKREMDRKKISQMSSYYLFRQ